ncbi:TonB-dependent receptor plug domain-containing protein [Dechloromonas agitata]|uniref:TonB-dependent receptor plug domain-containing protein n=1 Tax=Dechloromonas agitata TaxID=73030 RepID=UPI00237DF497|nr:TonB-dependent receptor plug domain-containing protein [Dechloromonas agitata]MDE1545544.1 TonB-dependent receptor plug domain-containing protein [Dechloromonas agitata]
MSLVALGTLTAFATRAEENIFFSSLPLVASVSRLPQQLSETPASVTIIDQEMIRASGMRTVEDLLRLVPGFQVTSHNQDPANVVYHGLNTGLSGDEYGSRVQVLVDGRSQYSPLFKSGVNWNLLPVALENIERIEVIRGSNTVSYGSNAFMGVVNIITMDPALTKGWQVSANHGNNGIRDEMVRWGESIGDANVRLTYRSLQDDGFQRAS